MEFKLRAKIKPAGDQPGAIEKLIKGIKAGYEDQTLLGVTGSGKTFTMASVIRELKRPAIVIAHNKTLAAQLCNEFREFFPDNAVEYFVSYYDYYQPEAYIKSSDTYIEKEAQVNEEIDRLRHSATQSLLTRRDVIVVASVSCIYNIGSPDSYYRETIRFTAGQDFDRAPLMRKLVDLQFTRNAGNLERGQFRARGNTFDIYPINEEIIYRLETTKNKLKGITVLNPVSGRVEKKIKEVFIFPAKHFVASKSAKKNALKEIRRELNGRLKYLNKNGLLLEEERLERRTKYDLEMMENIGYCNGIENYSRYFDGRSAGEPPHTLLSYFPKDYLLFIDESHVTLPQLNGMHNGDRARKTALIENGFRLPSAYDNRPLTFSEFKQKAGQTVFVSATPGDYEKKESRQIVEQIIRPTGLVDPEVEVRPILNKKSGETQVDNLIKEIEERAGKKERVLATTLTKKMAEDLSAYLKERGIKTKYLHSEIKTIDRIRILTEFRRGKFDCLIGVNLLREGLDLPEVTLVAILDADKEGFLRSETSLIQTIGRAARNVSGKVILYADNFTGSMRRAIGETDRRRKKQREHNQKHGITPQTIKKSIKDITKLWGMSEEKIEDVLNLELKAVPKNKVEGMVKQKEKEMKEAAKNLEFELAAILRDEIRMLKKRL